MCIFKRIIKKLCVLIFFTCGFSCNESSQIEDALQIHTSWLTPKSKNPYTLKLKVDGPTGTRVKVLGMSGIIYPSQQNSVTLSIPLRKIGTHTQIPLQAKYKKQQFTLQVDVPAGESLQKTVELVGSGYGIKNMTLSSSLSANQVKSSVHNILRLSFRAPPYTHVQIGKYSNEPFSLRTTHVDLPFIDVFPHLPIEAIYSKYKSKEKFITADLMAEFQYRHQKLNIKVYVSIDTTQISTVLRKSLKKIKESPLNLPEKDDSKNQELLLVAPTLSPYIFGYKGLVQDIDLIALSERIKFHPDGKCKGYKVYGKRRKFSISRRVVDTRWTVYHARTAKVIATRDFKGKRIRCPFSATKNSFADGLPSNKQVSTWLKTFVKIRP